MQAQLSSITNEFITDSSDHPICESCGDTGNLQFHFQNFKCLCDQCVDPESSIFTVAIKNPPFCILHRKCDKKGRWICSKSGIVYCDGCHIINCLLEEKLNFSCSPQPLYLNTLEGLCSVCSKINAEFAKSDGNITCHRCATTNRNSASLTKALQPKIEALKVM